MGPVGTGFQLGMSLGGHKEGMLCELAHFHDTSVGRGAGKAQAVLREHTAEIVVHLVAVAVSFVYGFLPV